MRSRGTAKRLSQHNKPSRAQLARMLDLADSEKFGGFRLPGVRKYLA